MAGKKGRTGNPGQPRHWAGPGRKPTKAVIKEGSGLMLSQVYPDGTADLGSGIAVIEAVGRSRLIKIPQPDGSEIRIMVVA